MMNMHLKVMEMMTRGPPIGTNSPVSSDADTVLYAASEDDKGIPGHSIGIHVGRKSGLKPVKLSYTGEGLICSDNFIQHNVLGDGNYFFRAISYLLLGQEVKHDVIRARIVDYIMDTNNFDKLRSYIPQHYPSGEAYIQDEAMADLTTWATEVELFACAQLCGKDIVCYSHSRWLRYPASGYPRKPTRSAFFIANKNGNHFNPL